MFKVYHKCVPYVFEELFTLNSSIHSYDARQLGHLHVPKARTNYRMRSIGIKGVNIWNNIIKRISYVCSLPCFKHQLKGLLLATKDINKIYSKPE